MTKEEAWKIIEFNRGFNVEYCPSQIRPEELEVLVARKKAWAEAWRVVGEVK